MKDFRELKVWEKSHRLTLKVYRTTVKFPKEELYGLTSQIRRACVSIPTNIAEECGRNRDRELNRFFEIAMGSASELEYLFCLFAISISSPKKNSVKSRMRQSK
jgi:four helix bundle protein